MNILALSVGTRNKVIEYFKKNMGPEDKLIATDMSTLAPALYEADRFYQVPRIDSPEYLDIIMDICKKECIDAVFSLIDPELSLLAKNEESFREIGVTVIGSPYKLCERALDKMEMYNWLTSNGYKCAATYQHKDEFYADLEKGVIDFPVFVKPIRGSASLSVTKVYDKETVEFLFDHNEGLLIQEFLDGQEIGADVYIDVISGEVVSIFTKKKLLMRAGETDKAVSFKDERLFSLIEEFTHTSGWRGQIDIDIFDINGEYYFSEVNPRFGGGYPHAHECGCNHINMILNNLKGIINEQAIGGYNEGIYMMKYNEVCIK